MIRIEQVYDNSVNIRFLSRTLASEIKRLKRKRLKAYRAGKTRNASDLDHDCHVFSLVARAVNILSAYARGRSYSSVEVPREGNEPQNNWTLWSLMKSSCNDPKRFENWIIST